MGHENNLPQNQETPAGFGERLLKLLLTIDVAATVVDVLIMGRYLFSGLAEGHDVYEAAAEVPWESIVIGAIGAGTGIWTMGRIEDLRQRRIIGDEVVSTDTPRPSGPKVYRKPQRWGIGRDPNRDEDSGRDDR